MRSLPLVAVLGGLALSLPAQDAAPDAAVDVTVELGVLPGLQYDKPRFAVDPGAKVAIRFANGDEMAHNLIVTKPGQRLAVVTAALGLGAKGPDLGYVPDTPDVLASIGVLDPGESATLRFTAPETPCVLPYVCTFPGHGFVMFGAVYVGTEMPARLADDPHVSPLWQSGDVGGGEHAGGGHAGHGAQGETTGARRFHAWGTNRRPLLYRIFMPDASPAAIAVALPADVSVCWDAGTCRLRYAWHGGFVDPWPVWKGNGNGLATIQGERFWVESGFPLALTGVGEQPHPRFRGYRLTADGHPEFRYELGEVTVRERLEAMDAGNGLRRRFQIDGLPENVRVQLDFAGEGSGAVRGVGVPLALGKASLTAEQAREFAVEVVR